MDPTPVRGEVDLIDFGIEETSTLGSGEPRYETQNRSNIQFPNRKESSNGAALSTQAVSSDTVFKDALVTPPGQAHTAARVTASDQEDESAQIAPFKRTTASTSLSYGNIRKYFANNPEGSSEDPWLSLPEIPTTKEIGNIVDGILLPYGTVVLQPNKIAAPWASKAEYLKSHYELLREDAVCPLRDVVEEFRAKPWMLERQSVEKAGIYENVYIAGITVATQGLAVRVSFSLRRAEKKIRWEQARRLRSGGIVALTPADDNFRSICCVAIVAARPLVGLQQDPPVIDLFFGNVDDLEIDPQREWVMVEAKKGYYESHRHALRALQKLFMERIPLSDQIISLQESVSPPEHLQHSPFINVSAATKSETAVNIDALNDWPTLDEPVLDPSQLASLRQILTKRLAIVQGPPGTGKTHVSVIALKILLKNMTSSEPPIIVTANTNHALDQLLRHVAAFEPEFVRLGGRSSDTTIIKPRTLYAIRAKAPPGRVSRSTRTVRKAQKDLIKEIQRILRPLSENPEPLSAAVFLELGLISKVQYDSLEPSAASSSGQQASAPSDSMRNWLGSALINLDREQQCDFDLEMEEIDEEFEQIKEMEAELGIIDDEYLDTLKGEWIPLVEHWTGRTYPDTIDEAAVNAVTNDLKQLDFDTIDERVRGDIYRYLQKLTKEKLRGCLREAAAKYSKVVEELKINRFEVDHDYVRRARIIGLTTTGLSKYRALLASVKPRVVLIEEAAETLEAHTAAALFDSLQHLILVGDHQQLRGQTAIKELAGNPYYLDFSMFERLVGNEIEFSQLSEQRRMRPEVRALLTPIYDTLNDHPSVLHHGDVLGMGGNNVFFLTHSWPESSDNYISKQNINEAQMIVGFFEYLVQNGINEKNITILTFYNGQRRTILRGLRKHKNLQGCFFNVCTVDSYQGEENDVIILSLVRNNHRGDIGFVDIANRICVALSRARVGFYLFGNATLLDQKSDLWSQVLAIMSVANQIGEALSITCRNHGKETTISDPSDWEHIDAGCTRPCQGILPCGHQCTLQCHPYSHENVNCMHDCERSFDCGHVCLEACHVNPCRCPCGRRALRYTNAAPPSSKGLPVPTKVQPEKKGGPKTGSDAENDLPYRFKPKEVSPAAVTTTATTSTRFDSGPHLKRDAKPQAQTSGDDEQSDLLPSSASEGEKRGRKKKVRRTIWRPLQLADLDANADQDSDWDPRRGWSLLD